MKKIILIIKFILVSFFICNSYSLSYEKQKLRVVSLAPSTTEILFALGLNDEIIGVSLLCNYPKEAQAKEKIGTFSQPNVEKILYLKPDIIFCTGLEQVPVVEKLRQLKLKVYVSDPSNIEELFNSIKDIGKLTDKEKEAEVLIKKMKAVIEEISSKVKLIPKKNRPRVFVEVWHDPLITTGKGSFIDELLTLVGGINIAYDTKRPYSYFSPELIIKRNPECVILTYMNKYGSKEIFKRHLIWKDTAAVKSNRIYNDIDPDLLLRPGPRLVEGLKEIYKRLYP